MAEQVLLVRSDVRAGLQQHYQRASRLEEEGFATKAQKLQAKVALDDAEREYRKAQNELQGAQAALSGILHSTEVIKPTTSLRSEERRVGKECRSRWSAYHEKKKDKKDM